MRLLLAACALALAFTAAVAEEPCRQNRAVVMAVLAEEPAQKIVALLKGGDADAFLDQISGPVGLGLSVLIADTTDPAMLIVFVFDGDDCLKGYAPIPMAVVNRLLHRTGA